MEITGTSIQPLAVTWILKDRGQSYVESVERTEEARGAESSICFPLPSSMLGVPAYWRSANGAGDVVNDPKIIDLIKDVDIIMPWFVGAYDYDGKVPTTPLGSFEKFFNTRIIDDFAAAESYGVDFCPLVFPGFSDRNMHPDHYVYDRHGGDFYWQQIYKFIDQGAKMLYVAMFDEIDEGTAIYKCLRKNEVPSNVYPSDYYVVFENGAYRRSDEPESVNLR